MNQKYQTGKLNFGSFTHSQAGFTYLETIIYSAILVVMMTSLIPFAWNVIGGGVKSATQQEVFSQARYVSERLKYEIRNARDINYITPSEISLETANAATNPTIIKFNAGNIFIQQGTASPVSINSKNTIFSSLTITNYSSVYNETKNIQFVFTIAATYPGAGLRHEYKESTTIEGSAEIRSN